MSSTETPARKCSGNVTNGGEALASVWFAHSSSADVDAARVVTTDDPSYSGVMSEQDQKMKHLPVCKTTGPAHN